MTREQQTLVHDEIDIANLEIRYIQTNDLVQGNKVDVRGAVNEGLRFRVSISNPDVVPDGRVLITLVIAKDRRNNTLGTSGNFRKNPHATIVQDIVTITGSNPATATIDLIHDPAKAGALPWHEGPGPYDVTMSVAPARDSSDPALGADGDSAHVLKTNSHTAHVYYHFDGV
jgi:hypothetical protein